MKHTIEKLPQSRIKAEIILSSEEFKKYQKEAFEKLASGVEIEGFRPGKAPKAMLEEKIGKDRIFSEALEHAIPHSLAEFSTQENIQPISQPKIALKKFPMEDKLGEDLVFEAEFDVLAEIKLPDWKKISLKKEKPAKVVPKEIEEVLANIQQSRAEYKKIERALKNGDRAEIDFSGSVKGVKIDQLSSKNHPFILGSGYFLPDFEKNLLGMKAGEEKEFEIKIPENIQDKFIAGKTVKFQIKVHFVEEVILPKLDDKFAQDFGKVKNLAAMKKEIEKSLENRKSVESFNQSQNQMLETLAQKTQIEIPETLIEKELDRIVQQIRGDIEMRGLTFGDYLNSLKKTEIELRKELRGQAEKSVKIALALHEISHDENIHATAGEIEDELKRYAAQGQKVENTLEVEKYLENYLTHRKTIDYLSTKLIK